MSDAVRSPAATDGSPSAVALRRTRLPRWSRREILLLLKGKRTVEDRAKCSPATAPGEPKWTTISDYCWRRGVERTPNQCRKRWGNLFTDFKKVREWERGQEAAGFVSFWKMKADRRREKKLPGRFDRLVYDILDGKVEPPAFVGKEDDEDDDTGEEEHEEEDDPIFDSRRSAAEDGLFSDNEGERSPLAVIPISVRKYEPHHQDSSTNPGMVNGKQFADNSEKGASTQRQKRRRTSSGDEGTTLESKLIDALESSSRMLATHLEAQNINSQLERDQRKDHGDRLVSVLGKLADAVGRIADKL